MYSYGRIVFSAPGCAVCLVKFGSECVDERVGYGLAMDGRVAFVMLKSAKMPLLRSFAVCVDARK